METPRLEPKAATTVEVFDEEEVKAIAADAGSVTGEGKRLDAAAAAATASDASEHHRRHPLTEEGAEADARGPGASLAGRARRAPGVLRFMGGGQRRVRGVPEGDPPRGEGDWPLHGPPELLHGAGGDAGSYGERMGRDRLDRRQIRRLGLRRPHLLSTTVISGSPAN